MKYNGAFCALRAGGAGGCSRQPLDNACLVPQSSQGPLGPYRRQERRARTGARRRSAPHWCSRALCALSGHPGPVGSHDRALTRFRVTGCPHPPPPLPGPARPRASRVQSQHDTPERGVFVACAVIAGPSACIALEVEGARGACRSSRVVSSRRRGALAWLHMVVTRRLHGGYMAVTRRLHGGYTRRLHTAELHTAVTRRLHTAVTRRLLGG